MVELFANSGDPDQTSHSVASDLYLHCLPITLLGVSRLQWAKVCTVSSYFRIKKMTTLTVSSKQSPPKL